MLSLFDVIHMCINMLYTTAFSHDDILKVHLQWY